MDIELHPSVSLTQDTFSVLVAPGEVLAGAINGHPELQRYKTLFICGNYSRILSRLDRNVTVLDVRRAFTVFQLMTILEESHHSLLIVEHDPLLYEDAGEMVEYLAQALKQTSREATVLLYAPAMDPHLQKIAGLADRVFCIPYSAVLIFKMCNFFETYVKLIFTICWLHRYLGQKRSKHITC